MTAWYLTKFPCQLKLKFFHTMAPKHEILSQRKKRLLLIQSFLIWKRYCFFLISQNSPVFFDKRYVFAKLAGTEFFSLYPLAGFQATMYPSAISIKQASIYRNCWPTSSGNRRSSVATGYRVSIVDTSDQSWKVRVPNFRLKRNN